MKQKKLVSLFALLMTCGLVGCNRTEVSSTGKTDGSSNGQNVDDVTKGFDSAVSGTTLSLTYKANYKVDINANGGTANLDSFKRDIEATTTADIDLTDGNFYLKVTGTTKDKRKNTESKTEALLYKGTDGKYYSMTTKSTAPAEVATADVTKTINSLLASASNTQVGGISLDTLIYKTGLSYELAQFHLTDTFTADDLDDPTYTINADGGLKVEYNPAYVGYQTDNGISDFKNHKTQGAATANIVLNTTKKGWVTGYTETYVDTGMDMPIMTPAPTVLITGGRSLSVNYGATLTKVDTIDHNTDTAYIKVTRDTNTISVSAKSFDLDPTTHKPGTMTDVEFTNNAGSCKVGANKWVALTVKPSSGFEVDTVKVNGNAATLMNGMYCFQVKDAGEYAVDVKCKASSGAGDVEYITIGNVTKGEHVKTVTVKYIVAPNFRDIKDFNDKKAVFNKETYIAIQATFDSGYTYDAVKVNDTEVTDTFGSPYYCYSVKAAGTFNVNVTAKAAA